MSLLLALIQGSTQGETWLELKEDWTSKPPIGTPLRSDGHWSVQGLVGAWGMLEGSGGTTFDSSNNQRHAILSPSNPPKWAAGSLEFNGSSTSAYSRCPLPNSDYLGGASGATVVCGITPSATQTSAGGGLLFLSNTSSTSATRTRILVSITSARAINLRCRSGFETQQTLTTANGVVVNDKPSVVSAVFDIGRDKQAAYVDSQKILEQSFSFTNAQFIPLVSAGCTIGAIDYFPGYAFGGDIHFAWLYAVVLSPDQIRSISDNPWQVYEPRSRWVKVGTATPGGTPGYGTPIGIASAITLGISSGRGKALKVGVGVGSSVTGGSSTTSGKGREVITGLLATSTLGPTTATGVGGSATAIPTCPIGTIVLGTSFGKGKAVEAVVGNSSSASVGAVVAKGKGKKTVTGLAATFVKDNDIARGKATKIITGVGVVIAVGTPLPQEAKHYAYPTGKQMTASVGTPAPIKGKGRALVAGVSTGGGGGDPVIVGTTQKVYFDSRKRISRIVKTITQDV